MNIGSHPGLSGIALLALAILAGDKPVSAQASSGTSAAPRYEMWAAVTGATSGPAGEIATSYSPPLLLDGDYVSHGTQTLHAESDRAIGLSGGINLFPTTHVGLQILLDRASFAVSGSNTPYAFGLQYTSRPPPNNELQVVSLNQSVAWPDTSGTLTQLVVGFNAVVRLGRPDHIGLTISGGPSYVRVSGAVQPVGYTTFHLGGRSVLFEDDYRLAVAVNSVNAVRFNVGGDLTIAVGRGTAVLVGYRYLAGPNVEVRLRPSAILNPDQVLFQQALEEIASRIAPVSMQLSPSGSRVLAGLKVMFH